MKKILLLLVAVMVLAVTGACNKKDKATEEARKQLATVVEQVKLPARIDSTTLITDLKLTDGVLVTKIEIPASRLSRVKIDSLSQVQINRLNSEMSSRKLRKLAVEGNVILHYIYYNGNDSITLKITPEQLK